MTENNKRKIESKKSSETVPLWQVSAQIADTALHSESQSDFYRQVLEHLAASFNSPFTMLYIRIQSEVIEDYRHQGAMGPNFWKSMAKQLMMDTISTNISQTRMFSRQNNNDAIYLALISVPIRNELGDAIGSLLVVTPCEDRNHASQGQNRLELLGHIIACHAEYVDVLKTMKNQGSSLGGKHLARAAGYSSGHELAFAITNTLRNQTGSDQVSLGLVKGKNIKIISVSGHDEVHKSSPEVGCIQEAMEECLDIDQLIIYQKEKKDSEDRIPLEYRLHRQWHEFAGNAAVASIPLHSEEGCRAILSLKSNASQPFNMKKMQEIRELTEPYTPAFVLVEKANRHLLTHAAQSISSSVKAVVQPKRWTIKTVLLLSLAFAAWFLLGTMDYQITVSGTVLPAHERHLAAPMQGVLSSANVIRGEQFQKGAVLCTLDRQDLLMERTMLNTQIKAAQLEKNISDNNENDIGAELAEANIKFLQAKLNILNRQIKRTVIEAPFDGWVVNGDLRKRLGEVVMLGEPLYEIASSQEWLLKLEVPEHLSADLKTALTGQYATNAKPEIKHSLCILNYSPSARLENGRNVYIAEARTDMNQAWIKAGMEGVAKIKIDRRRIWWVVLHKIINFTHLHLWL